MGKSTLLRENLPFLRCRRGRSMRSVKFGRNDRNGARCATAAPGRTETDALRKADVAADVRIRDERRTESDPPRSLARFNSNGSIVPTADIGISIAVDHCCSGSPRILFSGYPEGSSQFSDILQSFEVIDE